VPFTLQDRLRLYLQTGFVEGIRMMSQTGELAQLVPEWRRNTGPYRYQHLGQDFTLDEHNLRTFAAIDKSPYFAKLTPQQQYLVRTTALLHDLTKKTGTLAERAANQILPDPTHPVTGSSYLEKLLPALGFTQLQTEQVAFLSLNHTRIGNLAHPQSIITDEKVNQLAKTMKTRDQLNMLMALTEADIRSVRWDVPQRTLWTPEHAQRFYGLGQQLEQQLPF